MLARHYDQEARLPCGCHPEDASGPENADTFTATPRVCHRHYAVGVASEMRQKSETDSMHGVWFQITKEEV